MITWRPVWLSLETGTITALGLLLLLTETVVKRREERRKEVRRKRNLDAMIISSWRFDQRKGAMRMVYLL